MDNNLIGEKNVHFKRKMSSGAKMSFLSFLFIYIYRIYAKSRIWTTDEHLSTTYKHSWSLTISHALYKSSLISHWYSLLTKYLHNSQMQGFFLASLPLFHFPKWFFLWKFSLIFISALTKYIQWNDFFSVFSRFFCRRQPFLTRTAFLRLKLSF